MTTTELFAIAAVAGIIGIFALSHWFVPIEPHHHHHAIERRSFFHSVVGTLTNVGMFVLGFLTIAALSGG